MVSDVSEAEPNSDNSEIEIIDEPSTIRVRTRPQASSPSIKKEITVSTRRSNRRGGTPARGSAPTTRSRATKAPVKSSTSSKKSKAQVVLHRSSLEADIPVFDAEAFSSILPQLETETVSVCLISSRLFSLIWHFTANFHVFSVRRD